MKAEWNFYWIGITVEKSFVKRSPELWLNGKGDHADTPMDWNPMKRSLNNLIDPI